MEREQDERALLALRGGLRGRFRRSFDGMENAFEVLQDRLDHTLTPTQRGELTPILQELQAQLLCLRRLGDQASDAATAALLHGTCTPRPIDLPGQLREICAIIKEEAARYDLPFEMELLTDGAEVLPTAGDASLLNGLLTNLVSNTLAAAPAAHITLVCSPGKFIYRDNGPGLPPDAKALLTDGAWSDRLLHAGGLGLPLIAVYAKAMGWTTAAGDGPGTELVFTLPAAPDLDGLTLESAAEHYAEQQSRRLVIRRELAVAAQTISEQ
ncbi:ATP-binding protein [Gemmiger sp.]